jgi:hypothetical protein
LYTPRDRGCRPVNNAAQEGFVQLLGAVTLAKRMPSFAQASNSGETPAGPP